MIPKCPGDLRNKMILLLFLLRKENTEFEVSLRRTEYSSFFFLLMEKFFSLRKSGLAGDNGVCSNRADDKLNIESEIVSTPVTDKIASRVMNTPIAGRKLECSKLKNETLLLIIQ